MPDRVRSLNNTETSAQSLFDLIFPREMRIQAGLTDAEANALYTMWKNAPAGSTTFVPAESQGNIINALKTKGYVSNFGSTIELTDKGKKVIVEMVTHEPNAFEKNAQDVSYNQIKAKKNTRPKQAHVRKASNEGGPVFNLRQESIRRMSE